MSRRKRTGRGVGGSTRTSVEVLLADDVPNLGQQGDIVRVKPGYARNFLLPQGLATVATEHNKRMIEVHQKKLEDIRVKQIKDLKSLADHVSKHHVTIEANATQNGQLYGSILAPEISEALKAAGYSIEPEHIRLEGPLKETGMFSVKLQFAPSVESEVKVWVVPATKSSSKSE